MYKFERLEVWQLSLLYLDQMYDIAEKLPDKEKYNMASQLQRAATSISLNIAEGSTGQSNKEQHKFLGYALRSVIETVAVQKLIRQRNYLVDTTILETAYQDSEVLTRKLIAFRKALGSNNDRVEEDEHPYD